MRGLVQVLAMAVLAVLGFAAIAQSQVEFIPVTPVPPGPAGVTFVYPNVLVPPPNEKVFRFVGGAENGGFPVPTPFTVFFDWVEPGGTMFSPPFTFTLFPFMTNPIDTLDFILPFCPQEVSIHFVNGGPIPAFVTGSFSHECRPVPEPTGGLAIVAGLMCLAWGTHRAHRV